MFRRSHDKIMGELRQSVDEIVAAADARLEELAVNTFGKPDPEIAVMFSPPAQPIRVRCLHCGGRYLSDNMRLEYRPRMQAMVCEGMGQGTARLDPLWWCKNAYCDGAGFGHDVHPISAPKRKRAASTSTPTAKGEGHV